jgi:uncharacterized protein (DUF2252 family)
MAASPFGFFRGSAGLFAADIGPALVTGITVQLCGDAHLLNLGADAAPDGHRVFDLNDFDESLQGPVLKDVLVKATRDTPERLLEKTTEDDGRGGRRFRSRPPLLAPVPEARCRAVLEAWPAYLATVVPGRQRVLEAYTPLDFAFKVVGTGSVGTTCLLALCFGQEYAGLCGMILAKAHARNGDAARLAGYLGDGDELDQALGRFALAQADQVEQDHRRFQGTIQAGLLQAETAS